jgi:hypothetical protein
MNKIRAKENTMKHSFLHLNRIEDARGTQMHVVNPTTLGKNASTTQNPLNSTRENSFNARFREMSARRILIERMQILKAHRKLRVSINPHAK